MLSFSYYSVIKVQLHCLTSERCHRSFSRASITLQAILFLGTIRPGTHRRVEVSRPNFLRCILVFMSAFRSTNFFYSNNNCVLPANSVEMAGFEPATFALQRRCSPTELHPQDWLGRVGLTGFEPVTPALSAQCSNQLSYKPGNFP